MPINVARLLTISMDDSLLLLGPRGVGKSTLLKTQFDKSRCFWIDLLSPALETRYSLDPDRLSAEVLALPEECTHVIIDEIQKVPKLLDVVHYLIENTSKLFILTGSSARKLKKNAANLLAGRAFVTHLAPFTFSEMNENFNLSTALQYGMLPKIYGLKTDRQRSQFLKTYAHTYLKEEVWQEQFIRNLDPFRYFLEVSAQCDGKVLNHSKIARDVGVDYKTVENYYSILEDTLLGFFVTAYHGSFRKQLGTSPKFYFFDVGVSRALSRMLSVPPKPKTSYYGELFENFVVAEIYKYLQYYKDEYKLCYLRTRNVEIDLVVQRPGKALLLVEIKSSEDVKPEQLTTLIQIAKDIPNSEAICLSCDTQKRIYENVTIWPWQEGILHYFTED